MFGQHHDDDNSQNDQTMAPADDSMLASLPMPDASDPMPTADDTAPAAEPEVPEAAAPQSFRQPAAMPSVSMPSMGDTADDLASIKLEALQHLKPLVGHLEQTPEEKFRTTMMMIQASDDQSLIPEAFAAAKALTDDKARAQALLDVINEINYFTAQHTGTATV
jgi:hypothetical protein